MARKNTSTQEKDKKISTPAEVEKRLEKESAQVFHYLWDHRIEFIGTLFILVGVISAFFLTSLGGIFVGLGVGLCFFEELQSYILNLRQYISREGVFKTLMILGVAVYFLLALPSFLISTAVGFGLRYILNKFGSNLKNS